LSIIRSALKRFVCAMFGEMIEIVVKFLRDKKIRRRTKGNLKVNGLSESKTSYLGIHLKP
jgi:hypothetical protein